VLQMMGAKVYILLDIMGGPSEQVAQALRRRPGVVMVDALEGPPDVIMVVEASDRQKLAELTIQALASVETMTQGLRLLLTQNEDGGQKACSTGSGLPS
jgi:histidinol dehydrogenase